MYKWGHPFATLPAMKWGNTSKYCITTLILRIIVPEATGLGHLKTARPVSRAIAGTFLLLWACRMPSKGILKSFYLLHKASIASLALCKLVLFLRDSSLLSNPSHDD
eukprot:6203390-Pleurochrysis_carterae.AAC.2